MRRVRESSLPGYGWWRCPTCHIASCPGCDLVEVLDDKDVGIITHADKPVNNNIEEIAEND